MTPNIKVLEDLLGGLEAAEGSLDDETLGRLICAVRGVAFRAAYIECGDDGQDALRVTSRGNLDVYYNYRQQAPDVSLDSAFVQVGVALPGWNCSAVNLAPDPCEGYVWERGRVGNIRGKAATPALALLAATVRALISNADSAGPQADGEGE